MPTERSSVLPLITRAAEWPVRGLDVKRLRAEGHRPVPFRDVVLKVHQRCNLACDYCYVYEMADQSWRSRPIFMSETVWRAAADRMAAFARDNELDRMRLVLHGGEPLLAGIDRLSDLITEFRRACAGTTLRVQMQTNGVLLDRAKLEALQAHGVEIGVSVDGAQADHDRRRRHANGRGSFGAVEKALRLLMTDDYRESFAGLLCIVDPTTDPVATYEALLKYRPPTIDLLLPHANWDIPPDRPEGAGPTPYADWLIAVFDRWYRAPVQEVSIRLFEDVLALLLGGSSRSEQIGLSPVAVVVVESDGAIEQVDSLKSAYPGACDTGLNVLTDPLHAALDHPGIVARQIGLRALSETCLACPVRDVCGGGHYAHRYRGGRGFLNPSVYCADMLELIRHVRACVLTDLERRSTHDPA
ncbi:FxsB family radical SAM/SPASM domain protein [Actinoplanes sp. TRM 88003]|uniref:FxsB family radical SAM/SPASM domain protein n=1 Tax=Paractinoplanes aksuensis TaxID=2939490 RepID=A0ABT1DDY6_9ACTN|nr:FxsB family cyclophane-forming radical SAM/SPASM peptide maturase [Actinoplanes aksuensis]MCO8269012.1 FxsB family radical SAM/SPASM domain protein [Actinoplanes aksuensis]